MKTFCSKWNNFDLREMEGTNKLYDIVEYYGSFLWYRENMDEGAFEAFYNNTHENMKNIFINRANAEAKKYLSVNIPKISGRKMKRFLITGHNKRVVSYEWIVNYVEYILNECVNNEILVGRVMRIMNDDCNYCVDAYNIKCRIVACSKRLLGFQYELLHEVSKRGNMTAQKATKTMEKIEENRCWQSIISQCNV